MKGHGPDDQLLCECEMVSKQVVDGILHSIREQNARPDIRAIGLRSRLGKGVCQGAFCGVRVAAYMYEQGYLDSEKGLDYLKNFLSGRWRGIRPVSWGTTLVQEELQEAIHCGFFGLESGRIDP
jgi:glycerol-3-phosphate dehydrogenase